MKRSESKDEEAAELAQLVCTGSNASKVPKILDDLGDETVRELSTIILKNGHTILHLLAQRQKLQALQALLQYKGCAKDIIHTRNAQGATPLLVALQHNALFSAKVLLDFGANPSDIISRQRGTTLLHQMVTYDRPHAVMLLMEEGADANARDKEGRTPFHLAAIFGNAVIVAIFMRYDQCDVNLVDGTGHTGVMLAITNNNQELAKQMVEAPSVDITRRDNDAMSCLHLAVSLGQLDVARSLLRRNTANINSKELRMGRTPIHIACALGCNAEGLVGSNYLYSYGCEEDAEVNGDGDGLKDHDRPASSSRREKDISGVEGTDLLTDVAKVNIPPISATLGNSPYSRFQKDVTPRKNLSVANGYHGKLTPTTPRTPKTPRSRTPVKTPRTSTPRSPFTPRLGFNTDQSIKDLADASTPRRKTKKSSVDSSSMHQARHSISVDQVAHMPRPKSYMITTPFKSKQSTGSENSMRSHRPSTAPAFNNMHRQFDLAFPTSLVNFKIPSTCTGRESATSYRSRDSMLPVTPFTIGMIRCRMVALLLEYDADANLMTSFRKSPLHITSLMGAADVMSILLPHITNLNVLSASNKTALHLAVEGGHTALVSQLINAGANLMLRDISGMTALHMAAKLGHTDIASLLVKARVGKNSCDFQQRMPLHLACLHNHTQIVELLIKAGARFDRADDDGVMPLEYLLRHAKTSTDQRPKSSRSRESGCDSITEKEELQNNDPKEEAENMQPEKSSSMTPLRRRKMGIVQSCNGNGEPLPDVDHEQEPGPVVLYSITALQQEC